MPERQVHSAQSLQQWKGVNQRVQATLVQDGFFTFCEGLYFGIGDNAQRMQGKVLTQKLNEPVLQIFQMGQVALVQTLTTVRICPLVDITGI